MTKTKIIKETYEYYAADPNDRRGYNKAESKCYYINELDKKCAVGRCLDFDSKDENIKQLINLHYVESNYSIDDPRYNLEKCLIDKYKGHDVTFWKDLQRFHDIKNNWNIKNNCITEKGKKVYQELLKKYENQ